MTQHKGAGPTLKQQKQKKSGRQPGSQRVHALDWTGLDWYSTAAADRAVSGIAESFFLPLDVQRSACALQLASTVLYSRAQ